MRLVAEAQARGRGSTSERTRPARCGRTVAFRAKHFVRSRRSSRLRRGGSTSARGFPGSDVCLCKCWSGDEGTAVWVVRRANTLARIWAEGVAYPFGAPATASAGRAAARCRVRLAAAGGRRQQASEPSPVMLSDLDADAPSPVPTVTAATADMADRQSGDGPGRRLPFMLKWGSRRLARPDLGESATLRRSPIRGTALALSNPT